MSGQIRRYLFKLNIKNDINKVQIEEEIKKLVGMDGKITFEIVDEIPILDSGKRKSVLCEWSK